MVVCKIQCPRIRHWSYRTTRGYDSERLKYKRNGLSSILPEVGPHLWPLLASVFGVPPKEAQKFIDNHFLNLAGISKGSVTINQFFELLRSPNFFPRRLTAWALGVQPLREPQLFVCDAKSAQDIIDYWNLRAAGFYVMPVPIQTAGADNLKAFAREFIERNYFPHRDNPQIFYHTTIQKSRSLSEETAKGFYQSLNIDRPGPTAQPKVLCGCRYLAYGIIGHVSMLSVRISLSPMLTKRSAE